jgi:Skp family chaperone for outer membrane proteins
VKLKSARIALMLLALSLWLCLSPAFARESYTITVAQVERLSENLTTLKELVLSLRAKLDSYKQELQATAQELQASQLQLVKAENESNTFILTLKKQEMTLTEQSKSLQSAKVSLKRLRRRNKAKDILFGLIIVGLAAYR